MLEFVDLNLHLTHLVILWQLLYGTVFNKAWCVSFLVCSSKGAEHEGSLKTQRNTAYIEEVPLKKILRGHSEIDSTKCSVEFRLSFPQQTATLNWFGRMSFVRVRWKSRGHTEHLTGDDNMDQQSQPVKRKTVQLMLLFSSDDDSSTFCLLSWRNNLSVRLSGDSGQFASESTEQKLDRVHTDTNLSFVFSLDVVFMSSFGYFILQSCFLAIESF